MYCKFYEGKQLEIIFSGLSFYVYYFSATVIYKDAIFSAFVITFFILLIQCIYKCTWSKRLISMLWNYELSKFQLTIWQSSLQKYPRALCSFVPSKPELESLYPMTTRYISVCLLLHIHESPLQSLSLPQAVNIVPEYLYVT